MVDDSVQRIRYGVCVCVCMCERAKDSGDTRSGDTENTQANVLTKEKDSTITRWEEGALYSHPLSSLSTRHINMGNEEPHKLCVIEYDSMTHTKC